MKELDNLIEGTFKSKQKSKVNLISLVESVLDTYYDLGLDKSESPKQEVMQEQESTNFSKGREFILSLPKFAPNENWGDPSSADRKSVQRIFDAIGGGATLEAKLSFLQRITDPSARITGTRRIVSSLILLESLSSILNSFQAAPAGFVFESFLAALLRGHQIPATGANTIADLEAFSQLKGSKRLPISLKLLNPNTKIEGSYTDLIDSLNNEGSMTYVVARKDGKNLNIESFVFTQDNFIKAITTLAKRDSMSVRKKLFALPGLSPEQSIKQIQSKNSWDEQYQELRKTAGYRGKKPAAQEPKQPEQEKSGLSDKDREFLSSLGATGLDEGLQLNESKTQWSLDGEILDRLASEGAMVRSDLGTLPYDPEIIYQIAEQRMKYLDQNLLELFTATKSLSDNINLYITEAERSDAIDHGQKAVSDTTKVAETLQSEIKNDK